LVDRMDSATSLTERNASATAQLAAAMHETTLSVEHLARQAERLHSQIDRFKTGT
jgi:methyl-accepting chemotaxis protein